jgi:hypothetical protein
MSPLRPPDVQRVGGLVTGVQRAQASRDASAYGLANRVFNAALPYFGRKTPMPLMYWGPRTPGGQINLAQAPRGVVAEARSRGIPDAAPSGMLAYPYREPTGPGGPLPANFLETPGQLGRLRQQHFADILLHEMAHTQQTPPLRGTPAASPMRMEGGADAFAVLARDAVARQLGLGPRALYPYSSGYVKLGTQFLNRLGPQQALYGQFPYRR